MRPGLRSSLGRGNASHTGQPPKQQNQQSYEDPHSCTAGMGGADSDTVGARNAQPRAQHQAHQAQQAVPVKSPAPQGNAAEAAELAHQQAGPRAAAASDTTFISLSGRVVRLPDDLEIMPQQMEIIISSVNSQRNHETHMNPLRHQMQMLTDIAEEDRIYNQIGFCLDTLGLTRADDPDRACRPHVCTML